MSKINTVERQQKPSSHVSAHRNQIVRPKVNTKPALVSAYPAVFAPWPLALQIRHGCSCVIVAHVWPRACVNACVLVCVPRAVCIRTLLEPGSIWLTPAVCFKGWAVFWIWSAPQQSSVRGEQMKGSVQRGVNRKNSTTLLSEIIKKKF